MRISIIAAIGANRELGAAGDLLWQIPEDLKRFQLLTRGCPVIMGLKTYMSLPDAVRPLSGRTNIVLMQPEELASFDAPEGVVAAHTLADAVAFAEDVVRENDGREVFVIGGGSVYAQALERANRMYLTHVDASFDNADVFFPEWDVGQWVIMERRVSRDKNYQYEFVTYDKKA